jgi:hypothetical protein
MPDAVEDPPLYGRRRWRTHVLRKRAVTTLAPLGTPDVCPIWRCSVMDAVQNARLVANAERYYRDVLRRQ